MDTNERIYEFECVCGHVWLDDANYGCPMCSTRMNIVRRNYKILQPEKFGKRKKRLDTGS